MIGTKCRLLFIHYLPKNTVPNWVSRFGHVVMLLTGYIYSFEVYTGADKSSPKSVHGQGYDVILNLMSPLL